MDGIPEAFEQIKTFLGCCSGRKRSSVSRPTYVPMTSNFYSRMCTITSKELFFIYPEYFPESSGKQRAGIQGFLAFFGVI